MTITEVLPSLYECLNKRGALDKEAKQEIKKIKERVGDEIDFLQWHDVEALLLIGSNKCFDGLALARIVHEYIFETKKDFHDQIKVLSIASRPSDSYRGPGMNDKEYGLKILDDILQNEQQMDNYELIRLVYEVFDAFEDNTEASKIGYLALERNLNREELDELLENAKAIKDTELTLKVSKKLEDS